MSGGCWCSVICDNMVKSSSWRQMMVFMRGCRTFCQRKFNLDNFFLVEGREDKRVVIGPPAERHLNGVFGADR